MKSLFLALPLFLFATPLFAAPTPRTLTQLLQVQLHSLQQRFLGAYPVEASFDITKDDPASSLNTFHGEFAVVGDDVHLYRLTTIWDGVNDEEYTSDFYFLPAKPGDASPQPRAESPNLHPRLSEVALGLPTILAAVKQTKHEFILPKVLLTTIGRIRGRSPIYTDALAGVPDDKSIAIVQDPPSFYLVIDATTGIPIATGG